MNATEQAKCADRIGQEMAEREAQIQAMTEQAEDSEYYGDDEAIYELALSITVEKVATICLSWGGPADTLRLPTEREASVRWYTDSPIGSTPQQERLKRVPTCGTMA